MPEYLRWPAFFRWLSKHWQAGEHMAIVGQTGSGKTVATVELLDIRDYVVVIGTKQRDESLYDPLVRKGYIRTREFDPADWDVQERPRVIFECPLSSPSKKALEAQRTQIARVLRQVYISGGWTVALDEVGYPSQDLKLDTELNAIWREGRSSGISIVGGTQRPVRVPRLMWESATHNVDFRIAGKEDRETASQYLGDQSEMAREVLRMLPKHEFLYVDSVESLAYRSKVDLPSRN